MTVAIPSLLAALILLPVSYSFQAVVTLPSHSLRPWSTTRLFEGSKDAAVEKDSPATATSTSRLEELIREEFSAFYSLLSMNEDIWNTISAATTGSDEGDSEGAGGVTIAQGAGVTINGNKVIAQGEGIVLHKVATDEWDAYGGTA